MNWDSKCENNNLLSKIYGNSYEERKREEEIRKIVDEEIDKKLNGEVERIVKESIDPLLKDSIRTVASEFDAIIRVSVNDTEKIFDDPKIKRYLKDKLIKEIERRLMNEIR